MQDTELHGLIFSERRPIDSTVGLGLDSLSQQDLEHR